ncbi:hypothetical protein BKA70DRAFT_1314407 [Coprinopsis sp. MPI-PUGE-AT-0042]|nr:hypothetical protein BKA70DRAFT_1314407 [Coprinopsis sp. MPI-PUGE-AT-0042]
MELDAYIRSMKETPATLTPICPGGDSRRILAVVFRNTIRRPAVMGKEDCRTLISVRCVCKRWDGIITSTPTFWRRTLKSNGAGAPLRLSLGAIDHPSDGESSHRFTRFGGKPCRSLKRLALNIFPDDDKDIDLGILQSLTHLNLSFAIDTKIEQEPELDPAPHDWLPRLLNPGNFPALRHLELVDVDIQDEAEMSFLHTPPTTLHMSTFALKYLSLPSLKSLQLIAILDPYLITNTIGASVTLVANPTFHPQMNAMIVSRIQSCQTLQIASLDFIHLLEEPAWTSLALKTIICTHPIFDIRGLPDELVDCLYTWPSTHTLTIISPDPKPDSTQPDGMASVGLERLIKEGRVEIIPPYNVEGEFYMPVND